MADYIEREAIWPALSAACVPYNRRTQKAIEEIPAANLRLMNWIPVTERLPEMHDEEYPDTDGTPIRYRSSEPVLVWLGGGGDFMAIALYEADDDCTGWTLGGSFINSVTHWMQLPKPPEEAQE